MEVTTSVFAVVFKELKVPTVAATEDVVANVASLPASVIFVV